MSINEVQRLITEVDSIKLLEQYLRLAITTALDSHDEIAIKVMNREEEHLSLHFPTAMNQDKHFPVILISGWYLPTEGEGRSYFNGYESWTTFNSNESANQVDNALQHIKELLEENMETWRVQFNEKFGDGYNDCFNHNDGSVDLGFELRTCGCFPEWLAISIVHIYYGK